MPKRGKEELYGNLVRNLIISAIAILLTLYFYYRPFNKEKVPFPGKSSSSVMRQDNGKTEARENSDESDEKAYDIFYISAMKQYTLGNLDEAVRLFEKARGIRESDDVNETLQKIYSVQAMKKFEEGNLEEARKLYDKALEISPLKILIFEKANTYRVAGELSEALNLLEKYRDNYPDDADYGVTLSNILYETGKYSSSYEILYKILQEKSFHSSAQMLRDRIESKYSINPESVKKGKSALVLVSDYSKSPLTENIIYSAAGEVYASLSSLYGINTATKVSLMISDSDINSVPLTPEYDVFQIDTLYIPVDSLTEKIIQYKRSLKYLLSEKIIGKYLGDEKSNIFHRGISLKAAGYSFWGIANEELIGAIDNQKFKVLLNITGFPENKSDGKILNILALSFVDHLISEYPATIIRDIFKKEKDGTSFKEALLTACRKNEDDFLKKWISYYKGQTGSR